MGSRERVKEQSAQHAQYAFQLQPGADPLSHSLAADLKAKRKRTSPQDHAILEAAYVRNSKPDKPERAHIVSQVSLDEKGVQIWFQNRRQNDRRRSKPLQAHELVAHLRNTTASPAPHLVSSPAGDCSAAPNASPSNPFSSVDAIQRPTSRASSIKDLLNPASSDEAKNTISVKDSSALSTPPSSFEGAIWNTTTPSTAGSQEHPNASDPGSAKKRDHDEMMGGGSSRVAAVQPVVQQKQPLARSSSFVRLAMTVDGAVKVRTSNEPTPSPEKPRAVSPTAKDKARASMARSKSAINSVEIFRDSVSSPAPRAMGAGFGRSRDSRTWDFYCDNSKDALSKQAEAETSGSAVGAINLIRSSSFKARHQALSPSLSKTNGRMSTSTHGKPKLSRAKSSLGRLQAANAPAKLVDGKVKQQSGHPRSPSDDSDKENWLPGTRDSENALRRTQPSGSQRQILQENEAMTFPDASSSQKRRGGSSPSQVSPSKEKSKGEEIACIEGLLSLSQGTWTKA